MDLSAHVPSRAKGGIVVSCVQEVKSVHLQQQQQELQYTDSGEFCHLHEEEVQLHV